MQSFISIAVAALLAYTVTALPAPEAAPEATAAAGSMFRLKARNDFSASCSSVSFIGIGSSASIVATCGNGNGGQHTSTLNLNNCLGNNFGIMVNPGSDFTATCTDFSYSLASTDFTATCGNGKGGKTTSTISLDEFVSNTFGVLTC